MKRVLSVLIISLVVLCFVAWSQDDKAELGTWQLVYSNAMAGNSAFMKVCPADRDNLYVVGLHQHSAMGATYGWKSTDAGYSWTPVYQLEFDGTDMCEMLKIMSFMLDGWAFDADHAIIIGFGVNDECLETVPEPLCMFICMFQMIPKILYTSDGGDNWEQIQLDNVNNVMMKLPNVVYFVDDNVGFTGGYDLLYATYDGGQTWSKLSMPEPMKQEEAVGINGIFAFDHQRIFLATGDLDPEEEGKGGNGSNPFQEAVDRAMFYKDPMYRINVQNSKGTKGINGALYYTSDGGETWDILKSSAEESYYEVYFIDENKGWLLAFPHFATTGEYHRIYYTTDGGETWEQASIPETIPGLQVFSISWFSMIDENVGFAVAGGAAMMYKSVILDTTDGGKTWVNDPFTASANYPLLHSAFVGKRHGWAVGMNLSVAKYTGINTMPIADAGEDQTVHVGDTVNLDGTESYDPDEDPIEAYQWSLPQGDFTPEIDDPSSSTPKFKATQKGKLTFELVVSDGELWSEPDQVVITVKEGGADDDDDDDDNVSSIGGCGCSY